MKLIPLAFVLTLLATGTAVAEPTLKGDITVNTDIVTVGDMFNDPGSLSDTAIFRAPAPGTTGIVPVDDVATAARSIGLTDFDTAGYARIRVMRLTTVVDASALGTLISTELTNRGVLSNGITANTHFDLPSVSFNATQTANPAQLTDLRYAPDTGAFTARFTIAGIDQPVDLTGMVELMTTAPRLVATRAPGTILTASDFEMAPVPVKTANAGGYADLDQLIGKQLIHQSRAGIMLRPNDVAEPTVVTRNALVTVVLKVGAMSLTVKGQALTNAAAGDPVDVLNTVTKKILHGIANTDGTVSILNATAVASL
ncbi:MAG: flagellar basal body P-ring formation chaperone FlgA [Devosia sp.]